jgi:phospholipid/cholesterol/gamma-HCH transport system substrate-binding protein
MPKESAEEPMFRLSTEAKVGLFVLAAMILLAYMSFQAGKQSLGLRRGYEISAVFDNAAGLQRDSTVQIAGVEVGRVAQVRLWKGKALVILKIQPNVQVEKDATATIKTHGVLGDKYVEITPGKQKEAYLEGGEQITHVEQQADIDRLLMQLGKIANDIQGITGSLNRVVGSPKGEASLTEIIENTRQLTKNLNAVVVNNQETLHAMLENSRQLSENLNRIVTQNDQKIAQVIDNLQGATKDMQKAFANLNEISDEIKRGEGTLGQLVKDKTTIDKLNNTLASLQEITDKINQGKGTLGKLVNDEETVNNLNESLSGINRYINRAEQFRTFLSYRGEYLFAHGDAKSYLELKIQPKEDKFYVLGVNTDPRGRLTTKVYTTGNVTTTVDEYDQSGLLFNAEIAKRYRDIVLRGGILESAGGVGVDYLTFNDKLKLSFEAFDFSQNRRTHLKTWAEYQLFKHVYMLAGWDDFISDQGNSSPFGGFAIRFEDEDLKYLLTSAPIPKN